MRDNTALPTAFDGRCHSGRVPCPRIDHCTGEFPVHELTGPGRGHCKVGAAPSGGRR